MARYLKTLDCGGSAWHLSSEGPRVYFSAHSRQGGLLLPGVSCAGNRLRLTSGTTRTATELLLCERIATAVAAQRCYLTKLVCALLGRHDNDPVLRAMRRLRDVHVLRLPHGRELERAYLLASPAMAQALLQAREPRAAARIA